MPLDIGIVYWVCLASPRTSFYIPFHFGIADFPAGFRLPSQRPTAEAYDRKVQAPFAANPQEAFWTFSNFRDKMDQRDPRRWSGCKAEQQRIERNAVAMQKPVEDGGSRLYDSDRATAVRLLENYSKGVYLSSLEAMDAVLRQESDRMTYLRKDCADEHAFGKGLPWDRDCGTCRCRHVRIASGPERTRSSRKRASELAHEILLLDTHLDTPFELQKRMQDISGRIEGGHFDYVRARQGGLDALFMAVYVAPEYEEKGGAKAYADGTIDMIEGFGRQWPDKFALVSSIDEDQGPVRQRPGLDPAWASRTARPWKATSPTCSISTIAAFDTSRWCIRRTTTFAIRLSTRGPSGTA